MMEAARSVRVAVIGDAMIDHWVHGRVENCQECCPKFVQEQHVEVPGGAANAKRCLDEWCRCDLVALTIEDRPHKWRFVDQSGEIVFRHDDERSGVVGCRWVEYMLGMISNYQAVLLSDYDKGFLTPEFTVEIIKRCMTLKIPCVSDAKDVPGKYACSIIKGNLDWYLKHGGADVVTRGDEPPIVKRGEMSSVSVHSDMLPSVPCVNHVGAGDCFAAVLTLALGCGFSLVDAAAVAHSAGRVYVQRPHNRPPRPEEVAADLAGNLARTA